jgi:hypothetical protein
MVRGCRGQGNAGSALQQSEGTPCSGGFRGAFATLYIWNEMAPPRHRLPLMDEVVQKLNT